MFLLSLLLNQNCGTIDIISPIGFDTAVEADSIAFAVIGDFGLAGKPEKAVADMVKSWNPDFIITTGDNNYYEGKYSKIKKNITQYYGDYVYNYDAPPKYQCNGIAFNEKINRFFPSPGNHDANNKNGLAPYLNYFTLPGKENYYKFIWGPITFYSLDSETGDLEKQKSWLFNELKNSKTPFNIVYFHHAPWTTGGHSNAEKMQWDFYHHNVDIVFSGHDHIYAHIEKYDEKGMYYIISGLGGGRIYECNQDKLPSDMFNVLCYNENYGAVKATATNHKLEIKFYSISDENSLVDSISISRW